MPTSNNTASTLSANSKRKLGFNSGEHALILDKLPPGIPTEVTINGFTLDLRKIVALPDFFYPYSDRKALFSGLICTIASPTEGRTRENVFNANFDITFSGKKRGILKKFLVIITKEEKGIKNCQQKKIAPSQYYEKNGAALNRQYTLANPGYLVAALTDFDHFLPDALTAYQTGRKIAFELAQEAHQENDKDKFHLACAKLAFSLHFFTDSFSAGHIATPRRKLTEQHGLLLGSLLAKEHHDEASQLGFKCKNKNGKEWVVFGDGKYFDKVNETNRSIIRTAAEQVFKDLRNLYETGKLPAEHQEEKAIPELLANTEQPTCAPLFIINKNGKLLRRKEVNDPLCHRYTENWHAIPTLIERWLHSYHQALKSSQSGYSLSSLLALFSCFPGCGKSNTKIEQCLLDKLTKQEKSQQFREEIHKFTQDRKNYEEAHMLIQSIKNPRFREKVSNALDQFLSPEDNINSSSLHQCP